MSRTWGRTSLGIPHAGCRTVLRVCRRHEPRVLQLQTMHTDMASFNMSMLGDGNKCCTECLAQHSCGMVAF